MKFAVFGAGAVGCYYGGRLAATGQDVSFVVRSRRVSVSQENGIRIDSPLGNTKIHPISVTDDPVSIGPVDAILFGVKQFDLETAGFQLGPLLKSDTAILCMQNGVESLDRLAPIIPRGILLGAIVYGVTGLIAPGHVQHLGQMARIVFGGRGTDANARAKAVVRACTVPGIEAVISDDIDRDLWTKLIVVAPMGALSCLRRQPIGPILTNSKDRDLLRQGMQEIIEVAASRGVALPRGSVDQSLSILDSMDGSSVPSMLRDLQKGQALELEWWSGAVVRLGAVNGVKAPFHKMVCDRLAPLGAGDS